MDAKKVTLTYLLGSCVVCGVKPEDPTSLACKQHEGINSQALITLAIERAKELEREPNPPPKPGQAPASWDLVLVDIEKRDRFGAEKYGIRHQADNGRDHLVDAYEEALDLVVYLRAEIYRRDGR